MLFFQIQAAKIVKGERRAKRKRSFLAWLCRAASYLRETKITKGERSCKPKACFWAKNCRAASYLRETKIVKITHIYTIYFCKETKEGTDLLKKD